MKSSVAFPLRPWASLYNHQLELSCVFAWGFLGWCAFLVLRSFLFISWSSLECRAGVPFLFFSSFLPFLFFSSFSIGVGVSFVYTWYNLGWLLGFPFFKWKLSFIYPKKKRKRGKENVVIASHTAKHQVKQRFGSLVSKTTNL